MIAKTFITAFMAASFMAGTHASPCKVSSRTTDISTTVERSSATTSAEAISTATDVSSAEDTTLTASQSDASSATSSSEGVTTTTAISTTDLSTTIVESSTETSAISEDATTTTEGTTTAESTTTTAEVPPAPTFLANGGFDDVPDTTAPWAIIPNDLPFSISSTTKYEGRNSAQVMYTSNTVSFIRQPLGETPQAGVGYPLSAWVHPASGCNFAYIFCTYSTQFADSLPITYVADAADQWIEVSGTCTYTQDQINGGGLYMYVGFNCLKDSTVYIDSVTFGQ